MSDRHGNAQAPRRRASGLSLGRLAVAIGAAGLMAGSGTPAAFAQDDAQGHAAAGDATACIITKTDINPFFVKMKEGAIAKGRELGVDVSA